MKSLRGRWSAPACAAIALAALTLIFTYPLSRHPAALAYTQAPDAQFSIWNVGWVAHAVLTDPRHVGDANIFFPRTGTLFYSEANLAAGALAAPVYWLTGDVYAAHNAVVVLSFFLAALGMYALVRYLSGDRRAALVAGICFAFCPHVFSHLHHVQLLMTAGLPFSLLAFHRLADRPSWRRGAGLGLTMAALAYACAYYAIFGVLAVGFATLIVAAFRRSWTDRSYWSALAVGALVAVVVTSPLAWQYVSLRAATGFVRPLEEADRYAADWRAYVASAAYAHRWLLPWLGRWNEVLFPGALVTVLGIAGAVFERRERRELVVLYGGLGLLALWASFGPHAGLYQLLYVTVPGFTFLRAPARFGLLVVLALAVLAGLALSRLLQRTRHPQLLAGAAATIAVLELMQALAPQPVPVPGAAYQWLAQAPAGALLELPVYSNRFAFLRARYMLASTLHWRPLVNGYSDYIPQDFTAQEGMLGAFPSEESIAWLTAHQVRYVLVHLNDYSAEGRASLGPRLEAHAGQLRRLHADAGTSLYELVNVAPLSGGR